MGLLECTNRRTVWIQDDLHYPHGTYIYSHMPFVLSNNLPKSIRNNRLVCALDNVPSIYRRRRRFFRELRRKPRPFGPHPIPLKRGGCETET